VLLSDRLVALEFVINQIEVRALQWPEIWKFIQVSYITALSDWRQTGNNAQNVRVDTARGKAND